MERTASFRTDATSRASRSAVGNANAGSVDWTQEREYMALRRQMQLGKPQEDTASMTSSQREREFEREFAEMLGGADGAMDRNVSPKARNKGHELYYVGCGREKAKQDRLREERERMLMNEIAQMTQRPNITIRARSKPSKGSHFADHAAMWSAQRDHHLRVTAQQVAQERFAEVKDTPSINPRSDLIVKSSGDYKGPVRHWDAHFEKFNAKKITAASPSSTCTFSPNINANAVRVDIERSISDRLYEESTSRRQRLQNKSHEQQARELVDPATGRPFFTPHALRRAEDSAERRNPEELSAMLHEESFEVSRRRQRAAESHPDAQHSFKPQLNEVSLTIAGAKRKPLYVTRAQRLQEERERRERIQRSRSADQSPRPVTSPVNVDDFLRRAQRNETVRAQKLEQIRRDQQERETSECTFHPAITQKSEELFNMSNMTGTPIRAVDALSPVPATERALLNPIPRVHDAHASPGTPPPLHPVSTPVGTQGSQSSPPKAMGPSPRNRNSTADDFAAVMAASGLSNAHQFVATPASGARKPRAVQQAADIPTSGDGNKTPRGAAQQQQGSAGGGMGDVDQYIAAFESQMYSVLEEWRKLEEV